MSGDSTIYLYIYILRPISYRLLTRYHKVEARGALRGTLLMNGPIIFR